MRRIAATAASRLFATSCGGVAKSWLRSGSSDELTLRLNSALEEIEQLRERCNVLENQNHLERLSKFYASYSRTPIDIDQVVEKCCDPTYNQFIFCHRELPIVLAHLIHMLDNFPMGLFAMPEVRDARTSLLSAFEMLVNASLPDGGQEHEDKYCKLVSSALDEQEHIVETIARGIIRLRRELTKHRKALGSSPLDAFDKLPELQHSLDNFYLAFVQFKFLALQLIQTHAQSENNSPAMVGIVNTSIDLRKVARLAVHKAQEICDEHYGDYPEVDIELLQGTDGVAPVTHLSDHLTYILLEVMKNAIRATVEYHKAFNDRGVVTCDDMPLVKVKISTGSDAMACVIVSDQGGGIRRCDMQKVMGWSYTSVPKKAGDASTSDDVEPTSLAGYGYGLPMSRIHARLFGGDLRVQSVEGYGTDVYLMVRKKRG